jgi:hypothetical protein
LSALRRPKTWRGRKVYYSKGYPRVLWPEHPCAEKNGLVYIHRAVMAAKLGRPLLRSELVHHKDEDTTNWRVSNLKICTRVSHAAEHARGRPPSEVLTLTCAWCKKMFSRRAAEERSRSRQGGPFCSRSCGVSAQQAARFSDKPAHGTQGSYRRGCRCDACRSAHNERIRKYRQSRST